MKRWILVLLAVALGAGCDDNELGLDKRRPNRPPETTLASGPPDSSTANYRVRLFWSGSDPDGTVDHYDYIMVDHERSRSQVAGDDTLTTVVVEVPAPNDPRWLATTANDSIFVTASDTLRRDPRPGPRETPDDVRGVLFDRWHTFFVRAVDNEGLADLTPDYRTFNSTNIAPTVSLTRPIVAGQTFTGPSTIVFNWEGADPVGDGNTIDPVASRWVVIPTTFSFSTFPESLYALPRDCGCGGQTCRWSPWRRWDAADESGRRAVVRGLCKINTPGAGIHAGYYIFAVQALDEAGATTVVFDRSTGFKNNAVFVRVDGSVGPILTITDPFLGVFRFGEGSRPVRLDIAAGQPLSLSWVGDPDRYGGSIVGYRYGWDLLDPSDDTQWDQSWARSATSATTRSFNSGTHRFFLQVRDNAETVVSATLELTVHQVTRNRDILWVDDSAPIIPNSPQEETEDQRWIGILESIRSDYGIDFEAGRDVYDVIDNLGDSPPLQLVFDYRTVVWSMRGTNRATAISRFARFVDPYVERNRNLARSFNYLNIYLKNGGTLWLNGDNPARDLWPPERETGREADAVNVTNWNDPREPHPFIDSAGTTSLLYIMGVEMFDCGANSGECRRKSLAQFCKGIRRAAGEPQQKFISTEVLAHTHSLDVLTVDVDLAPAEGRTYETSTEADHKHTVTLSSADLIELQRGNTVEVTSAPGGEPAVATHTHAFTLIDQRGDWGAPVLVTGANWPVVPTNPGRPNVEIYNMPGAMGTQSPPLQPLPGLSLTLYEYASNTPAPPNYPATADKQPVLVLSKGSLRDPHFQRAIAGFEPELLTAESHHRLTEYILVRHFRVAERPD